ncbi:MAG: hypothetical protein WAV74_09400 [Anaerolineae bacterium]
MNRFQSHLLTFARLFWLAFLVFKWVYWVASMPRFFALINAGAIPTAVTSGNVQVSPELFAAAAAVWGLAVPAWAVLNTLINILSSVVFTLTAALVAWRLRTWFSWLTAMVLLVGGSNVQSNVVRTAMISPVAQTIWEFGALIWPLFFVWLYLFPDGRAVPRRLRWIIGPLVAVFTLLFVVSVIPGLLTIFPASADLASAPARFGAVLIVPLFFLVLSSQIYRYLRVSGRVDRDQTKWFLFGLVVAVGFPLVAGLFVTLPTEVEVIAFMAIPLGIGVGVLRYRLWDIDVIIRKTLVYTAVTALLALVYFGGVVLLQRLFGALTGVAQSPLAVVVSTLAIAALFTPLRRRLQDAIDRRFFRKKYDAQRVLAQFAQTARDETDLDALTGELARVVQETLQPERVSVWLNKEWK